MKIFLIALLLFSISSFSIPARSPAYLNLCRQTLSSKFWNKIKTPSSTEWVQDAKQLGSVISVLNNAFAKDPLLNWMSPHRETREALMQTFVYHAFFNGGVLQTKPAGMGAALWMETNKIQTGPLSLLLTGQAFLAYQFGLHSFNLLKFDEHLAQLRKKNLAEEKACVGQAYYLFMIGVDPAHTGKSIATTLLRPILDDADYKKKCVILETQKLNNIELYKYFGFKVSAESQVPSSSPLSYLMIRTPK